MPSSFLFFFESHVSGLIVEGDRRVCPLLKSLSRQVSHSLSLSLVSLSRQVSHSLLPLFSFLCPVFCLCPLCKSISRCCPVFSFLCPLALLLLLGPTCHSRSPTHGTNRSHDLSVSSWFVSFSATHENLLSSLKHALRVRKKQACGRGRAVGAWAAV